MEGGEGAGGPHKPQMWAGISRRPPTMSGSRGGLQRGVEGLEGSERPEAGQARRINEQARLEGEYLT